MLLSKINHKKYIYTSNTNYDLMLYYVIVCPDKYCRGITIASKKTESKQCMECNKSYKFDKYKIAFETEDHNQAIAARTQLITKQSKKGPEFEEIKNMGGLEEQESVFPKDTPEKDNRSPKEIVLDSIESVEEPTEENIISNCVKNGVNKEKAEKILNRTLQQGYAIKKQNKTIVLI